MSVLQTVNLSADAVKMRWKEPYVTAGINQKFIASHPKGVLAGFSVVPSAGFVVAVQLDPSLNLSVANVLETTGGKFSVTVVQTANVLIDLTAQANTTVFIVLDAQYTVGASSAAQVKVVDAAELSTNLDLVVLAKVNVPLVGPITTSHINLGYRDASGDFGPMEQNPHFNLVHNPSFEASTVGWTNVGFTSMTASTDTAHSANYSLKLVQAAPGLPYAITGPMPVVPARAYRTTAWLRSTGSDPVAAGNGAKVQVGFYDSAGAQIGGWTDIEATWTGGSTTWEIRRSEVTAPALALTAKLRVFFDNAQGTLYVDDVEFASHMHDEVMKSAVFGGAGAVADDWHKHTALGLTYAGSPNWADGTNIPAGTIESGVDGSPGALGPTTGATKVGFTPTPGVDITVGAPPNQHVSKALNELDTLKAGLNQPNVFTKNNVVTSSVVNTTAVTATGNGTGDGVSGTGGATGRGVYGQGGATSGTGVYGRGGTGGGVGVVGQGWGTGVTTNGGNFYNSTTADNGVAALNGISQNPNGVGVWGVGTGNQPGTRGDGATGGTGHGVYGQSGTAGGYGVYGLSRFSGNPGVVGEGKGAGQGVYGRGDNSAVGTTVVFPTGVYGIGGVGANTNNSTSRGGDGGVFQGGDAQLISSTGGDYRLGWGGHGIKAYGGTGGPLGSGQGGHGVWAQGGRGLNNGLGAANPGYGGAFYGISGEGFGSASFESSHGGGAVYAQGGDGGGVDLNGGHAIEAWGGLGTGIGSNGVGVWVRRGYVRVEGNPGITDGFTNTLTAKNICKAWGSYVADAGASPAGSTGTVQNGFNILKITHDAFKITVWFATAVLSSYSVVVTMGDVVNLFPCVRNVGKGTSTFDIELVTTGNTIQNPTNFYVQFAVFAAQ